MITTHTIQKAVSGIDYDAVMTSIEAAYNQSFAIAKHALEMSWRITMSGVVLAMTIVFMGFLLDQPATNQAMLFAGMGLMVFFALDRINPRIILGGTIVWTIVGGLFWASIASGAPFVKVAALTLFGPYAAEYWGFILGFQFALIFSLEIIKIMVNAFTGQPLPGMEDTSEDESPWGKEKNDHAADIVIVNYIPLVEDEEGLETQRQVLDALRGYNETPNEAVKVSVLDALRIPD